MTYGFVLFKGLFNQDLLNKKRNDEAGNKKSTTIISDKSMILSDSLHECSSQRDNEYKTYWSHLDCIQY